MSFILLQERLWSPCSLVRTKFPSRVMNILMAQEKVIFAPGGSVYERVKAMVRHSRQILNPLKGDKLVASLHRNSIPEDTALASPAATSWQCKEDCTGPSGKRPVLAQRGLPTSEQGALSLDRERFTWTRRSCPEPDRSVGKVPGGERSLAGEPECLSLHSCFCCDMQKRTRGLCTTCQSKTGQILTIF